MIGNFGLAQIIVLVFIGYVMVRVLREIAPIQYGIIALTLFTAAIHFVLGDLIFILNGLGYLTLLAIFMLPRFKAWQKAIRWLLIAYSAVTIVGYFVVHRDGSWQMDGLGVMTKLAEVILILLLLYGLQPATEPSSETEA